MRWAVDELLAEFASQVDAHIASLTSRICSSHWRTSPETLVGARIAVFRKCATAIPTVVTGVVIAPLQSTGDSKLRVAFDTMPDTTALYSLTTPPASAATPQSPSFAQSSLAALRQRSLSATSVLAQDLGPKSPLGPGQAQAQAQAQAQHQQAQHQQAQQVSSNKAIVADVAEPFWVRSAAEGSAWLEADEMVATARPDVSVTDRRLFWEMARAVVSLPQLAAYCKGRVRNSAELSAFLLRKENKCIWYPEAPLDFLPKDDALTLIRKAYCLPLFFSDVGKAGPHFDR